MESLQANNGDNVFGRWIIVDDLIKNLAKAIAMDADTEDFVRMTSLPLLANMSV